MSDKEKNNTENKDEKEDVKDEKSDQGSKDGDKDTEDNKDEKLNPEQEKLVKNLVDRMSKISTNMEKADNRILDNAHERADQRKHLLGEIDTMKQEMGK
jgi:hypothetical protein